MQSTSSLAEARQILESCQQQELLDDLNKREEAAQTKLADQIVALNKVTPGGGINEYCQRARTLLESSKNNVNPFDQFKPEIPDGVFLKPGEAAFDEMEKLGLNELEKLCFVLIAGGLGERLGYSGIKIALPVCTIEEDYTYMRYYSQYVIACEERAR